MTDVNNIVPWDALAVSGVAELACALLNSLDWEVDADAETCWEQEIFSRIAELDSGEVKTVRWTEVQSRVSATLQHGNKKG
jgi:hypothetical protein